MLDWGYVQSPFKNGHWRLSGLHGMKQTHGFRMLHSCIRVVFEDGLPLRSAL